MTPVTLQQDHTDAMPSRFARFLAAINPLSQLDSPRDMIRRFTPNWFASTMGTGILSLLLPQVPGIGPQLYPVGEFLWLCNIGLFLLYSTLYTARWILFWNEAKRIFSHDIVSMFIGTIPMGLATILNGFLLYGVPRWGADAVDIARVLWWIDSAMSLACGVMLPYLMFTRQEHRIEKMTAVWLLPVVAAEVAGTSGGLLVPHLSDAGEQFTVLVSGYVLWALSVPVAMCIIAILFMRLALYKLPPGGMAASSWLPLGPLGTGSLGMLVLGTEAPAVFAAHGMAALGPAAQGFGVVSGILLWGAGLWWMLLAVLITIRHFRAGIPFNLGWWGYTFPLGVYTAATFKLGKLFDMAAFSVFGTVLFCALACMWVFVSALTFYGGWKGHLFISPCIESPN